MKAIVMMALALLCSFTARAYDYAIESAGPAVNGEYLVKVTVQVNEKKFNAADIVKQCAVHGVMFRGIVDRDGYNAQKAIVSDPNVEQTKSEFFKAFFNEGSHNRYASIIDSSLDSVKLKKKSYQVSGLVSVNMENLRKYLEESGIIKGFSNLW
ncbi:MAG: hypothetical protein K2M76_02870 [Muribaculaceae bacterium]|nr:hypothetical protein [Muribaculaceae bacterium]